MIDPLRVANLAPSSFGIFSMSCDGSGIVAMLTMSPTLIAGAGEPVTGAGLMKSRINRTSSDVRLSAA
jgi:hypothetical protein